jgi:hypothetical protein
MIASASGLLFVNRKSMINGVRLPGKPIDGPPVTLLTRHFARQSSVAGTRIPDAQKR